MRCLFGSHVALHHPGGSQQSTPVSAAYRSLRYSWTIGITVAPSPTADATRFIDRCRTSPAASTPGMLVSRKGGSTLEWPARRLVTVWCEIAAGEDVAPAVAYQHVCQPLGSPAGQATGISPAVPSAKFRLECSHIRSAQHSNPALGRIENFGPAFRITVA